MKINIKHWKLTKNKPVTLRYGLFDYLEPPTLVFGFVSLLL